MFSWPHPLSAAVPAYKWRYKDGHHYGRLSIRHCDCDRTDLKLKVSPFDRHRKGFPIGKDVERQ